MQRIIFLNRFFFPDYSATSQMVSDLAFHLAACGHDVHVIASQQRYDNPHAGLPNEEQIYGVHVHRIAATRFGRGQLAGRAVDYLSYLISSHAQVLKLARPGDVVIAKTDPPLLSISAMHATSRKGAHLVNWLQDLYPEAALALGVPFVRGPVGQGLKALRDRSLRHAIANIAVGERMAMRVRALGVPTDHITVIANWSDDETLVPIAAADNPLRREWQLTTKFVIGYSGNLGRAHEFDTVLRAAEQLRDHPDVVFLFIGGGRSFDELAQCVNERKLARIFRFMPYQDREQLKYSLGVPDVHLLSLRPEVEGLIVPSKFYGIAAAGRPVLAVITSDGEFAPLIKRHGCGIVVEPGDSRGLAQAVIGLASDPLRCAAMGAQARRMLDTHFSRRRAFERWEKVLHPSEQSAERS